MEQKDYRRLRRKVGTADDPMWAVLALDPGAPTMTVGGVPEDGDYIVTVTPVGGAPISSTFDRAAAEDNAAIAAATQVNLAALIAGGGTLSPFFASVGVVGAVVRPIPLLTSAPFTLSLTAPGAATFVLAPDDTFPISTAIDFWTVEVPRKSIIEFAFVAVDAGGLPLPDDNGMSFDVAIVEVIIRATTAAPTLPVGVTQSTTRVGVPLIEKLTIGLNGSQGCGIQITNIATEPTDYVALEVWIREGQL